MFINSPINAGNVGAGLFSLCKPALHFACQNSICDNSGDISPDSYAAYQPFPLLSIPEAATTKLVADECRKMAIAFERKADQQEGADRRGSLARAGEFFAAARSFKSAAFVFGKTAQETKGIAARELWRLAGDLWLSANHYKGAAYSYGKAIEAFQDTQTKDIWFLIAGCHKNLGNKREEAYACIQAAKLSDKSEVMALSLRAVKCCQGINDYLGMGFAYERAARLTNEVAEANKLRILAAENYARANRYQEAGSVYSAAAQFAPHSEKTRLWELSEQNFIKAGRFKEASFCFGQIAELTDLTGARDVWLRRIDRYNNVAGFEELVGYAYEKLADLEEGAEAVRLYVLGALKFIQIKKWSKAASLYETAAKLSCGDEAKEFWLKAGENLFRSGKFGAAGFAFSNAAELACAKEAFKLWEKSADSYFRAGNWRSAAFAYEEWGKVLRSNEYGEDAAKIFLLASEMYSKIKDDANTAQTLMWAAAKIADKEEAKKIWLKAALILIRSHDSDQKHEAIHAYKKAANCARGDEQMDLWFTVGRLYFDMEGPEQAGRFFYGKAKDIEGMDEEKAGILWLLAAQNFAAANMHDRAACAYRNAMHYTATEAEREKIARLVDEKPPISDISPPSSRIIERFPLDSQKNSAPRKIAK